MKTLNNTTAKTILSLFVTGLMLLPTLGMAQENWNESGSWLQTFYHTLGYQASPAWMLDHSADAEIVYESADGKSFALLVSNEYTDTDELMAEMQSPIVEGHGTNLIPISEPQHLGNGTYQTEFQGTLSGQQVRLVCINQWSPTGEGKNVMVVSTGSFHFNLPVDEANEFALGLLEFNSDNNLVKH